VSCTFTLPSPAQSSIPMPDRLGGASECQAGIGPDRHDAAVIKDRRHGWGTDVGFLAGAKGCDTTTTMLGRRGVHQVDATLSASR
jgi:hypothetical protein